MRSAARLATIVLLGALLGGCDGSSEPAGTATIPEGREDLPPPDQVVEDGRHVITVEGVKKAIIDAEQLAFYNRDGTVVGDTIQVQFFDEAGRYVSMLTALTGEMEQSSQRMMARGNVFVRGSDSSIKTDEILYDPIANRISSDRPTEILQRGNTIRGRGFESDPGLENIRIRAGSAVLRSEPQLGPERSRDSVAASDATPDPATTDGAPAVDARATADTTTPSVADTAGVAESDRATP